VSAGNAGRESRQPILVSRFSCGQVDQNERQIGNPSQIFGSCLGSASPNLDRWSRSCRYRERENDQDRCPSGNPRNRNEAGNDLRTTIEFAADQTARLICKIKMGLSETSFVLYREDGSRLVGDAGPAGHHGPIVLICGLVGFAVGIVGLAALI